MPSRAVRVFDRYLICPYRAWQYKYQLQPWNVRKRPTKEQRNKIARLVLMHRQRGIDARYHRRGNQLLKRTLDRWVEELCVLRGTASVRSSELSNVCARR